MVNKSTRISELLGDDASDPLAMSKAVLSEVPNPFIDAAANPMIEKDLVPDRKPFKSAGEKIHKWASYLAVDWLFNAVTGVTFAYWGKFTESGQKYWSGPITEGFTKLLKPIIKNEAQLVKSAGYGNMFMSIIAGGMFTIPPLMILENRRVKKSIVESLDNKIYGADACATRPEIQQAHEDIDNAPKKDFVSGLSSRFAALAPLLAMVIIPASKRVANRVWFDHVEHASEAVAKRIGVSAEKTFSHLPVEEGTKRLKFVHESVAMDFGLGIPYAVMHEFFYSRFAKAKQKQEQPESAPSAQTPDLPTGTQTQIQIQTQTQTQAQPQLFADKVTRPTKSSIVPAAGFVEKIHTNIDAAIASPTIH